MQCGCSRIKLCQRSEVTGGGGSAGVVKDGERSTLTRPIGSSDSLMKQAINQRAEKTNTNQLQGHHRAGHQSC